MSLQEPMSFLTKMLGETVGFVVFAILFAAYFPVFAAWFIANAISMGVFAMLTDGSPPENRGGLWWIFPAIPTLVLIGGGIVWTVLLASALLRNL
ncbi:hypothetical protein [Bradyrhizobium sp. cf659]|uniref:hypothetical protein n=1 Tax=Bradyrhizobium sp. cf659 TaxID=1761771 RepID=UPI0008E06FF1|nr:hypothetical protein [Bradyrhizobium sp. cf659]SFH82144.1 hypothetical protein SAMN04487925_101648 [Bradyrhizobium sp. cf659]